MDSWRRQLAEGLLLLTVLAAIALLPIVRWRISLWRLVIGVLSLLLILPVLIFLLIALSLGSAV
jgi:hypothetical protein